MLNYRCISTTCSNHCYPHIYLQHVFLKAIYKDDIDTTVQIMKRDLEEATEMYEEASERLNKLREELNAVEEIKNQVNRDLIRLFDNFCLHHF